MNFLFGIFAQQQERMRLEELEKKMKSARLSGLKHCVKCGFCCHKRTCIPTPNELEKTAEFLKLKPLDLINRYYVVDRGLTGSSDYYVKPVGENIKDLAGKFIPSDRTFNEGKCVFLDGNNLCRIYPVRPKSAKAEKCWIEKKSNYNFIKFWEGNQLLKRFGINGEKLEEDTKEEENL